MEYVGVTVLLLFFSLDMDGVVHSTTVPISIVLLTFKCLAGVVAMRHF